MSSAPLFKAGMSHEMLVLDAYLNQALDQSQHETITRKLIDSLLRTLNMDALGPLEIYPAVDLRAPGWSFIQPITTSHISGHYFEAPGRMPHIRLDAYSCKCVDWQKLLDVLHEELDMEDWRATFITRKIDDGHRTITDIAGRGSQILHQREVFAEESPLLSPDGVSSSSTDTAFA